MMDGMFTGPGQAAILAVAVLLVILVGVVLLQLWKFRSIVHSLIRGYLNTDDGQKILAVSNQNWLSTPAGRTFIEGVINGKVRDEVEKHNSRIEAHHILLRDKNFATREEMNGLGKSLREAEEIRQQFFRIFEEGFQILARAIEKAGR